MMDVRAEFDKVLQHLRQGDFSLLAPYFQPDPLLAGRSKITAWLAEQRFESHPAEALEALTCACFLGQNTTAQSFLERGFPATGGATSGMNALHYSASRGHVATVRLLLRYHVPLELLNMYGSTALTQTIWSALNQPMPGQLDTLRELIHAGANKNDIQLPTGSPDIDALLRAPRS